MIQEKDFLYRVPVKTAPITTPRGQIRNPEILVDLEGGEFMHGNILDANSTNKLINQSVKDAVDDKFIESGYVTKDLLEAETSARTKGDEDLGAKIQAEQTRAEGKEKEISDKLAIVDGDSNTEGSFRKAIADVIAAAPEDLDTLKEIADKLAGNDDLHTALNQAITEKADASALANEVTRATGAESGLQAAIATKADATALSNYVLTTALNRQVDTLNAAISAKQDAGNYIPFEKRGLNDDCCYIIAPFYYIECRSDKFDNGKYNYSHMSSEIISVHNSSGNKTSIDYDGIVIDDGGDASNSYYLSLTPSSVSSCSNSSSHSVEFQLTSRGLQLKGGRDYDVLTSNGSTIDITQYAKKTELPTVPTKTSQLTNDSNFIAANRVSDTYFGLTKDLKIYSENNGEIMTISHSDIRLETDSRDFAINNNGFFVSDDADGEYICSFTTTGIRFADKTAKDIPTADGTFINVNDFASADDVSSLRAGLSRKQDKITVNEVDTTDIETADITKLRTIVTNLINALSASDLIRETEALE